MSEFLSNSLILPEDTITGSEGMAVLNHNGSITTLFHLKTFEANFTFNKTPIPRLGQDGLEDKVTGWSGTFSATLYYGTSDFVEMVMAYRRDKKQPIFDLIITNSDPGSRAGTQRIKYTRCSLDSIVLSRLDVAAPALEQPISGKYGGLILLDEFQTFM